MFSLKNMVMVKFPKKLRLSKHFLDTQLNIHPERNIGENMLTTIIFNGKYMKSKGNFKFKYNEMVVILDKRIKTVITAYPEKGCRKHDKFLINNPWQISQVTNHQVKYF